MLLITPVLPQIEIILIRLLDVRSMLDQHLETGTISVGVVTVVGEDNILCTVKLPNMELFTIPLVANFHFHRLQALPFVEWTSITQYGEEMVGLDALTEFIATHHLVPDLPEPEVTADATTVVKGETSNKRSVVRSSSDDESLSKVWFNCLY